MVVWKQRGIALKSLYCGNGKPKFKSIGNEFLFSEIRANQQKRKMANTYTQLYVQFVFSVQGRANFIMESFRDELEKVMCGIVSNHKCKTYALYCNPDHTHLFASMHPTISPSKLMEQVKSGSSTWLNNKKCIPGKFVWQEE